MNALVIAIPVLVLLAAVLLVGGPPRATPARPSARCRARPSSATARRRASDDVAEADEHAHRPRGRGLDGHRAPAGIGRRRAAATGAMVAVDAARRRDHRRQPPPVPQPLDRRRLRLRPGAASAPASSASCGRRRPAASAAKIRVGSLDDIKPEDRRRQRVRLLPRGPHVGHRLPEAALDKARRRLLRAELAGMEAGFVALYQKCVHLGCRVPECKTSQWFECPCHGSQYNQVGEKKGGPAPRGLDRFAIEVERQRPHRRHRASIIQGPPIGTNTTGQEAEGPHCLERRRRTSPPQDRTRPCPSQPSRRSRPSTARSASRSVALVVGGRDRLRPRQRPLRRQGRARRRARAGRRTASPTIDDEVLEGPKLDRASRSRCCSWSVLAVGIPCYWVMEPARQENAADGFGNQLHQPRRAAVRGRPATTARALNCAGCHGGLDGGVVQDFVRTDPTGSVVGGRLAGTGARAPCCCATAARRSLFILTYGRPGSPDAGLGRRGRRSAQRPADPEPHRLPRDHQLTPEEAQAAGRGSSRLYMEADFEDGDAGVRQRGRGPVQPRPARQLRRRRLRVRPLPHRRLVLRRASSPTTDDDGNFVVDRESFEAATENSRLRRRATARASATAPPSASSRTAEDHVDFVTSRLRVRHRLRHQRPGRRHHARLRPPPARGRPSSGSSGGEAREPTAGMLTPELIDAIVDYERQLDRRRERQLMTHHHHRRHLGRQRLAAIGWDAGDPQHPQRPRRRRRPRRLGLPARRHQRRRPHRPPRRRSPASSAGWPRWA